MIWIPAEHQKNHKDTLLPMAPEFAELLRAVKNRKGFVFTPTARVKSVHRLCVQSVGKVVSKAGELANVKVSETKYASAHDFRRSFGLRWSQRVMPQVLQQLMRHETIETTMKYYVGRNAEATAAAIWSASLDQEAAEVAPRM